LYFLKVGGVRIAVRIALLFQNKLYMLKAGYDPQYASYAPGHVLSMKILEEAWRLRFDEVDFLGDAERWKLDWATDLHRHVWLFVFPGHLKSRLLYHLKVRVMPRIKATRRAVLRHGVRGCLTLAARHAKQNVLTTLYRHERHVWYVAAPGEVHAAPLADGLKLRRSRREHLDLLTPICMAGAQRNRIWEKAVTCGWYAIASGRCFVAGSFGNACRRSQHQVAGRTCPLRPSVLKAW
jgi:hypothetical protein